ncbi:PssE/Cps14G family polysaccharide biosynthesis glycosyltransferase [Vibrio cyclitrophicus]
MIKIFVTVGTTEFDELIKAVDELKLSEKYKIVAQVSPASKYNAKYINTFEFVDDIDSYMASFDLIITHAGAGSVYNLLEKGKRLLVVPNTERYDKHQIELAEYILHNNYAQVCLDINDLSKSIIQVLSETFTPYSKEDFFGENIILDYFKR